MTHILITAAKIAVFIYVDVVVMLLAAQVAASRLADREGTDD